MSVMQGGRKLGAGCRLRFPQGEVDVDEGEIDPLQGVRPRPYFDPG